MNIYVMAAFGDYEKVNELYKLAEGAGHIITHKWTEAAAGLGGNEPIGGWSWEQKRAAADGDIDGVMECDLGIWICSNPAIFGGCFEAGVAHATGKELWVIDPYKDSPFFYINNVDVMTWDEMLDRLGILVKPVTAS